MSSSKLLADDTLRLLEERKDELELSFVDDCIVCAIREIHEDGSDELIGHVDIGRSNDMEYSLEGRGQLEEVVKELKEKNQALPPGDPDVVWTIEGPDCRNESLTVCSSCSLALTGLPSSWNRD